MNAAVDNFVDRLTDGAVRPVDGRPGNGPATLPNAGVAAWPAALICVAAGLLGMAPTFGYLAPAWWESETYSHGLLVAPLCLWLLWRQRHAIAALHVGPSAAALAMLIGVVFLWMLAHAAIVQIGVETMFPVAIVLAIAATLGWRPAARVAFPVGFLYFATSVWDAINSTLQSLTTLIVSFILKLIGVPAFIEGNVVQIPSGWFEVAGGCSGLHFFIVAGALAGLYSHLHYRRWRSAALLLGAGLFLSLVANWLRVAAIITAGHLTDMQHYLVQVDHYAFGWVVFAVALVPFFLLARSLEQRPVEEPTPADTTHASAPGDRARVVPRSRLVIVAGVLLLPALVWGRAATEETASVQGTMPQVEGWQGPGAPIADWFPEFAAPAGEHRVSYDRAGRVVDVYTNWYMRQGPGRELIGYGNHLEGDTGWQIDSRAIVDLPSTDTTGSTSGLGRLHETVLYSERHGRHLIWSWYLVGHAPLTSPAQVKLLEAWRTLTGRHGAGVVALSTDCAEQCGEARATLRDALRDLGAPLSRAYSPTHQ